MPYPLKTPLEIDFTRKEDMAVRAYIDLLGSYAATPSVEIGFFKTKKRLTGSVGLVGRCKLEALNNCFCDPLRR